MIRTLYGKLLVGIVLVVVLPFAAFVGVTALLLGDRVGPAPRFAYALSREAQFAEEVFHRDGREGLTRFLKWLDDTRPGRRYLIDESGRDMLDGADRGDLVAAAARPSNWPGPPNISIGDPTPSGRSRMVIVRQRPPEFGLIFVWVPFGVIAACLALIYFLLRPLRRLQDAVKRFGRGDFSVRSGVNRRDEIGRLAAEFDRMAEKVERLVAAERRLLQDVSHELRSPLARLAFALELAERGTDRAGGLARARKEYARMRDLVGELVELTRAEAEGTSPPTEEVDLSALITEIADDVMAESDASDVTIACDAPDPIRPAVRVPLLRPAIENVLRNAVRFAPRGSEVLFSAHHDGEFASIEIRDAGPGVPDDAIDAIFTPFFRVGDDRVRDEQGGGVGLGLSIARRAVALHGGTIAARNIHPGLCVTIRLPIQPHSRINTP